MTTSGQGTAPSGSNPLSHLPWSMIPSFKPGETDINEYSKKLEFIANLWPAEHLSHLAPRAALLCEGSSFKKVMRIDTAKLKVNDMSGMKLLVTTLGGIWGKSNLEEKFEKFERAIFSTTQRGDESHESYLARHDHQFEELLQMNVGFEEVRAYILLRNSGLGADDKKRLIVDSKGTLKYDEIVNSLKLLGSKFFVEVQSGSRTMTRNKTYDVNAVFDDEPINMAGDEEHTFVHDTSDDYGFDVLLEENDPDAIVCMQFEDSVIEALQADTELSACLNTYVEARKRLTERVKHRGFWGPSKGQSFFKGRGKGKGKSFGRGRKPLAQRILEDRKSVV